MPAGYMTKCPHLWSKRTVGKEERNGTGGKPGETQTNEPGGWRFSIQKPFMEKAMAPHSSTLAWKIPWTEEPGRLQSMGSRRVEHD